VGDGKDLGIIYSDGFLIDLQSLPSELQNVAFYLIDDLARGRIRGKALASHPEIGDLSDCFKLYFDVRKDMNPRYRLVYRILNSGEIEGLSIEAIAVGRRQAFEVYKVAIERIGRA
jgi:hypothetical protein